VYGKSRDESFWLTKPKGDESLQPIRDAIGCEMLPIIPVFLLALEIVLCATVGFRLFGDTAMRRLGELSICIMLWILLVRLVAVFTSFWFANRHQTQSSGGLDVPNMIHQTTSEWFTTLWREYFATLVAFSFLIPFRAFFAPRLSKSIPPESTVVLLVHGLMSNSGVWWYFARGLRKQRQYQIDSLDLGAPFRSIDDYVLKLDQRLKEIAQHSPARIILVGHSMGGLVCRGWFASHLPGLVTQLITLGTPHQGSLTAYSLGARNLVQMRPHSYWLKALPIQTQVSTKCFFSTHDNLVVPYEHGKMPMEPNEQVNGLGHLSLLFNHQLRARVIALIARV
jgi:triacylglycerol lipase